MPPSRRLLRWFNSILLAGFALGLLPSLSAQASTDPLAIALSVFQVGQDAAGAETFSPADQADPGAVLSYQAVFTNRSPGPLTEVRPFLPIPAAAEFVEDSGVPPGAAWVLSDGAELDPMQARARLAEAAAAGTALSVRGLRWGPLSLAPGATFEASVRARLPRS